MDGTKIRANAARGKNYTKQHGEKKPVEIDKNKEVLLDECERIDKEEDAQDSLVKMKKELADNEEYRNRVQYTEPIQRAGRLLLSRRTPTRLMKGNTRWRHKSGIPYNGCCYVQWLHTL